jgi:hypothetical protein
MFMKSNHLLAIALLLIFGTMFSCSKEFIDISDPEPVDTVDTNMVDPCDTITYGVHITNLLNSNCTICHITGGTRPTDFTQYSVVKDNIDKIEEYVLDPNSAIVMPPVPGLSNEEKERLQCWIDAGGPNN